MVCHTAWYATRRGMPHGVVCHTARRPTHGSHAHGMGSLRSGCCRFLRFGPCGATKACGGAARISETPFRRLQRRLVCHADDRKGRRIWPVVIAAFSRVPYIGRLGYASGGLLVAHGELAAASSAQSAQSGHLELLGLDGNLKDASKSSYPAIIGGSRREFHGRRDLTRRKGPGLVLFISDSESCPLSATQWQWHLP
jgi:hypothetical protein